MWYESETMGNIVKTRREVIAQVFDSLFRYRTIDVRWKRIWL